MLIKYPVPETRRGTSKQLITASTACLRARLSACFTHVTARKFVLTQYHEQTHPHAWPACRIPGTFHMFIMRNPRNPHVYQHVGTERSTWPACKNTRNSRMYQHVRTEPSTCPACKNPKNLAHVNHVQVKTAEFCRACPTDTRKYFPPQDDDVRT